MVDGRCVGIGVSNLSKIPTVSNGWTLWEGGIKGPKGNGDMQAAKRD